MSDEIKLAEVLATKISHDLAGLSGAVNNGLEMLAEETDPDMKEQANDMALQSATEMIARLKYYRECYGTIKTDTAVSFNEVQELINNFYSFSKVNIKFNADDFEISQSNKKLLLAAVIVVSSGLIRGGEILVTLANGTLKLEGGGQTVKFKDGVEELVLGQHSNFESSNVNAYYLRKLAENNAKITKFSYNDANITIEIQ